MSAAAFELALVAEGPDDRRTCVAIVDRLLCDEIDWITRDHLASHRSWRGIDVGDEFVQWRAVLSAARNRGLRAHGHFGDHPGEPDAFTARLALRLFASLDPVPAAVLLVRDADDQPERRRGLEQARKSGQWPFRVVIGLAAAKRECWVLRAFVTRDVGETDKLKELRRELGFDPILQAHELHAQQIDAKRSAKRVLASLVGDEVNRESDCWDHVDLRRLGDQSDGTGLLEFVLELRTLLLPLWGVGSNRR